MSVLARRSFLAAGSAVGIAAVSAVTSGCRAASSPTTPTTPADLDDLLARWTRAVLARDRVAHDALWADGGASRATVPASLPDLDLVAFAATRAGATTGVGATTRVDWQPRDSGGLRHELPIDAVRGESGRLVLRFGDVPPGNPVPLWWTGPSLRVDRGDAHLLVGTTGSDGQRADTWAGRPLNEWADLLAAAVRVAMSRTGRTRSGTQQPVWALLPRSTRDLQAVLGAEDAARAGAAAYTTVVGAGPAEQPGAGVVQVLLDPTQLGALAPAEARALLVHEVVHVVTAAPRTSVATWVEEGYAEVVAWADDEPGGWVQAQPLLARARQQPDLPPATPSDDAFAADPLGYAISWTRCRWLLDRGGWSALRRWYDLQSLPPAASPPRDESAACREVYGMDAASRDRQWWAWLVDRARS